MTEHKIKIVFFKESGKFYLSTELNILPEEYLDFIILTVSMEKIRDRIIRELPQYKNLPGIFSNWLKEGYIYIDVSEIGYPTLILKGMNYSKPYIKI